MQRETISKTYRDYLLASYPALANREDYQRHARRILFSTRRSQEGHVLCGQPEIAADMGVAMERDFAALPFMEAFQRDTWGPDRYTIHAHRYLGGDRAQNRVRLVELTMHTDEYRMYAQELRGDFRSDKRVYLVGGRTFDRSRHARLLAEQKERAQARIEEIKLVVSEASHRVLRYQNDLDSNIFTGLLRRNLADTYALALDPQTFGEATAKQDAALCTLGAIEDHPQPLYAESPLGHTDRVFGLGTTILNLSRSLRAVLTRGLVECDLACSQLGIAAAIWNIEEIRDFLEQGASIWTDLIPFLCPSAQSEDRQWKEVKEVAKRCLYGVVYGMGPRRLQALLRTMIPLGVKDPDRFTSHWAIEALLHARDRVAATLALRGYVETCFGKRIPIEPIPGPWYQDKSNVPSAMAEQAQALELDLILPVYDLAEQTDEFKIALYQFDGLSIWFRDSRRADRWRQRIKEAVDNRARERGVPTWLEWK